MVLFILQGRNSFFSTLLVRSCQTRSHCKCYFLGKLQRFILWPYGVGEVPEVSQIIYLPLSICQSVLLYIAQGIVYSIRSV